MSNIQLKNQAGNPLFPITKSDAVQFSDGANLDEKLKALNPEVTWDEVKNKPTQFNPASHTHNEYSLTSHNHDAKYSLTTHNHDANYATKTHTHSNYDPTSILVDSYNEGTQYAYNCSYMENVYMTNHLTDSTSSSSSSIGASAYAVKKAYDLANSSGSSGSASESPGDFRVRGNRMQIGSSYARLDATGTTTLRCMADYSPDYAVRISGVSGNVDIVLNNTAPHQFRENGTKFGGSIEINGTIFGMSPIDSPQMLIEDVLFDIEVLEEGTTIKLDNLFKQTITTYAVFPSNGKCEVVSKEYDQFTVKGVTGVVDFRIVGKRIGEEDIYFAQLSNFDVITEEEKQQLDREKEELSEFHKLLKQHKEEEENGGIK